MQFKQLHKKKEQFCCARIIIKTDDTMLLQALIYASIPAGTSLLLFATFLFLLTIPWIQAHVMYLHGIQMTSLDDLDTPVKFGFLYNQVTAFEIQSSSGRPLYTWHILPVQLYHLHEQELLEQPAGFTLNPLVRLGIILLRSDRDAQLVIQFHGAGGTVASGYRCSNYRALLAGLSFFVHVLTFDYRGFGRSAGEPIEKGIIEDSIAVVHWAIDVARVLPSRIIMFGQSLGTAVNTAVAEHYAMRKSWTIFGGHILTAPFVDVGTLMSTYRVAGIIPILGPLARFLRLMKYLQSFIIDKWSTQDRISAYVRNNEVNASGYRITTIHAKDDRDIPWTHTPLLFRYAVNASVATAIKYEKDLRLKERRRADFGHAGSIVEWRSNHGIIRKELLNYGLHDVTMSSVVVTSAVARMLQ